MDSELVVALDVGTTKACALVAEAHLDRPEVDVLGVGLAPNRGMVRGVVADLPSVADAIGQSVRAAEQLADVDARTAVVSIAGDHITSQTEIAVHDIHGGRPVTPENVAAVRKTGMEIQLPADREILHYEVADFAVDGKRGIADPVGMTGRHLEAQLNIVTGGRAARLQLDAAVRLAGLGAHQYVLQSVAAGMACLTEEERQRGVVLVYLGGGTTDVAFFRHGALAFEGVVPLGSGHVTRDIAKCFETTVEEAEALKLASGTVDPSLARAGDVEFHNERTGELMAADGTVLAEIVGARLEETLELARDRLMLRGCLASAPCGIVLAGGGHVLPGLEDLARRIFGGMPTRCATPLGVGRGHEMVRDPSTHVALGLALLAARWNREEHAAASAPGLMARVGLALSGLLAKLRRRRPPPTGQAATG